MSVQMYKNFIEDMINQGIKVEELKLTDVSASIKLFKLVNRGDLNA